jgi:hypothetical protein
MALPLAGCPSTQTTAVTGAEGRQDSEPGYHAIRAGDRGYGQALVQMVV